VLVAATGRGLSIFMATMLITVGCASGAIAWDRRITRAVQRRRGAAAAEFPIVADLLCLAVTAGESLRGGLALVAESINGPLGEEIRWALRDARSGKTLAASLTERAVVLGEPGFERFVRSVIAATERGVAIASSLQAMASDARDLQRVALVEAAGRKQVTMLIPVVGLILPVALVFAFFPGIVAIRHLT
jgi:tight adherence protein C